MRSFYLIFLFGCSGPRAHTQNQLNLQPDPLKDESETPFTRPSNAVVGSVADRASPLMRSQGFALKNSNTMSDPNAPSKDPTSSSTIQSLSTKTEDTAGTTPEELSNSTVSVPVTSTVYSNATNDVKDWATQRPLVPSELLKGAPHSSVSNKPALASDQNNAPSSLSLFPAPVSPSQPAKPDEGPEQEIKESKTSKPLPTPPPPKPNPPVPVHTPVPNSPNKGRTTFIAGSDVLRSSKELSLHSHTGFVPGFKVVINEGGPNEEQATIESAPPVRTVQPLKWTHAMGELVTILQPTAKAPEEGRTAQPQSVEKKKGLWAAITSMSSTVLIGVFIALLAVAFVIMYVSNLMMGRKGLNAIPFMKKTGPGLRY